MSGICWCFRTPSGTTGGSWRKQSVRDDRQLLNILRHESTNSARMFSLLHRIGRQSGPDFAKRLKLDEVETLLDLGGGAATNAIVFCGLYPNLKVTVFDLPATLTTAERRVNEAGLQLNRFTAGRFQSGFVGGPYQAVLMSDILHYQGLDGGAPSPNRFTAGRFQSGLVGRSVPSRPDVRYPFTTKDWTQMLIS